MFFDNLPRRISTPINVLSIDTSATAFEMHQGVLYEQYLVKISIQNRSDHTTLTDKTVLTNGLLRVPIYVQLFPFIYKKERNDLLNINKYFHVKFRKVCEPKLAASCREDPKKTRPILKVLCTGSVSSSECPGLGGGGGLCGGSNGT